MDGHGLAVLLTINQYDHIEYIKISSTIHNTATVVNEPIQAG